VLIALGSELAKMLDKASEMERRCFKLAERATRRLWPCSFIIMVR
jgi:hypothetical protein